MKVGMTSKFRDPSIVSLVLTFLTTESNATSDGLFRGWANVPGTEDAGVTPPPLPPFVIKFPTDDDSDIP